MAERKGADEFSPGPVMPSVHGGGATGGGLGAGAGAAVSGASRGGVPSWLATGGDNTGAGGGIAMRAVYNDRGGGDYLDLDMLQAGDSDTEYSDSSDADDPADWAGLGGGAGAGMVVDGASSDEDVGAGGGVPDADTDAARGSGGGRGGMPSSLADDLASASYCDVMYLRRSGVDIPDAMVAAKRRTFNKESAQAQKQLKQKAFGPTIDEVVPDPRAPKKAAEFYGKELDDEDDAWMKRQCKDPKKKSDALLNCAFCFTTLCFESERHHRYHHQFRARTAVHCVVDRHERLIYQAPTRQGRRNQTQTPATTAAAPALAAGGGGSGSGAGGSAGAGAVAGAGAATGTVAPTSTAARTSAGFVPVGEAGAGAGSGVGGAIRPEDVYAPVKCLACRAEVGVMDSDGIYHFFNVLPSSER